MPEEALHEQLAVATDGYQQAFTALAIAVAAGDVTHMARVLELFPVQLTTVEAFARRMLEAGG